MAVGIAVPARANRKGGFARSQGNETIIKLLAVALGNNDSINPFQEFEFREPIFDLGDETTFADVAEQIRRIFDDLEDEEIAALQERSDNLFTTDRGDGEFAMAVYFVNLETGLPGEATVSNGLTGLFVR